MYLKPSFLGCLKGYERKEHICPGEKQTGEYGNVAAMKGDLPEIRNAPLISMELIDSKRVSV